MSVPDRMAELPTVGKYVVPFAVLWTDGKPDFRLTDPDKTARAVLDNLCWMCGQPNEYWIYFIGGPRSMESRLFNDGPMHKECAEYAVVTCPFLSDDRDYRGELEGVQVEQPPNPGLFGVGRTRAWAVVNVRGVDLIYTRPFVEIVWYQKGERVVAVGPAVGSET